jgi:hypothetical protein
MYNKYSRLTEIHRQQRVVAPRDTVTGHTTDEKSSGETVCEVEPVQPGDE